MIENLGSHSVQNRSLTNKYLPAAWSCMVSHCIHIAPLHPNSQPVGHMQYNIQRIEKYTYLSLVIEIYVIIAILIDILRYYDKIEKDHTQKGHTISK